MLKEKLKVYGSVLKIDHIRRWRITKGIVVEAVPEKKLKNGLYFEQQPKTKQKSMENEMLKIRIKESK